MDKTVQPGSRCCAKHLTDIPRNIFLCQHPCPYGIVHIMVDIGNLIGKPYDAALQCHRMPFCLMIAYPVPDFKRQIQTLSALFQNIHRPHALFRVVKSVRAHPVERPFSRMSEGRMSQVMPQSYRLGKLFVQRKRLCYRACVL